MVLIGRYVVPLFGGEALHIPDGGALALAWLLCAAVSLAAIGWALLVATLTRTPQQATVVGGDATWQLLGWPGAAWEVRDDVGTTVASGVLDATGAATATVPLPSVPSGTVLSYDYGYVQDGFLVAASPGLTATAV